MKLSCPQIDRFYLLLLTFLPSHTSALHVHRYDPDPALCQIIGHPQYHCPEPIWCFSDWPHETGNYGGDPPPAGTKIPGIALTGGLFNWPAGFRDSNEFLDPLWPDIINGTDHLGAQAADHIDKDVPLEERFVKRSPGHPHGPRQEEESSKTTILTLRDTMKLIPNPNTCCRPTIECYNHVAKAKRTTNGKGDVYIEDFDDWQKTMCCIMEWVKPRPGCPQPDDQLPILWLQPGACSNNYTSYEPYPGK